jgi:predicted CoA-binding protein
MTPSENGGVMPGHGGDHMSEAIQSFLRERRIAVVGVSRRTGFGRTALAALRAKGYQVFPVNAEADAVHGERCWRSLADLPADVGAALVVVPPKRAVEVVAECARLRIRKVWLQQGAESPEALMLANREGLLLVHHACILMYADPHGIHRVHHWLAHLGKPKVAPAAPPG